MAAGRAGSRTPQIRPTGFLAARVNNEPPARARRLADGREPVAAEAEPPARARRLTSYLRLLLTSFGAFAVVPLAYLALVQSMA